MGPYLCSATEIGTHAITHYVKNQSLLMHELLGSLQWNGRMDYCNKMTLTSQLSCFLGTFWLSDDHINMVVEEILIDMHAERPEDMKYVQVASLFFAQELWNAKNYELHVKEDGLLKLYFPIHVSENHWIVGMINFQNCIW